MFIKWLSIHNISCTMFLDADKNHTKHVHMQLHRCVQIKLKLSFVTYGIFHSAITSLAILSESRTQEEIDKYVCR